MGSSSLVLVLPNIATTASPIYFSTVPPNLLMTSVVSLNNFAMNVRSSSWSSLSDNRVYPLKSVQSIVTKRYSDLAW